MSKYPIPAEAFDDRLAIFGTAGAGKTYLTIGAIARLLERNSRVIAVDPLGVMWGLRSMPDGKPSPFKPVIFGGDHGDLPLNEHAGALIGETAATMRESCILDLSGLGTKAAERRFMLAFLIALYKHANKEPVHLVFDEADMWAPQKLLDKDGDAAKLLGMMETVVRRGRVKGFVPWLITQRPAVLSKDVLSQADGVVALKLTAKQDKDAFEGWIEGQADRVTGKAILTQLPTFARGQGVVWIPGRGVLDEHAQFPANKTFDSSRTPKRGETISRVELKPLDLGKLQERLAAVRDQAQANDPKVLRGYIATLEQELAKLRSSSANPPASAASAAVLRKSDEKALAAAFSEGQQSVRALIPEMLDAQHAASFEEGLTAGVACAVAAAKSAAINPVPPRTLTRQIKTLLSQHAPAAARPAPAVANGFQQTAILPKSGTTPRNSGPVKERILRALAELEAIGVSPAPRIQAAFLAGYKHDGVPNFRNNAGALRSEGLVEYPDAGTIRLTAAGRAAAPEATPPRNTEELHQRIISLMDGVEARILPPVIAAYPNTIDRDEVARAANYAHAGVPNFRNTLGRLRSLGFVSYPSTGTVRAEPTLFLEGR